MVVSELISNVGIVVLLLTHFSLEEVLEVALGAVWVHILLKTSVVSESLVRVLGFSHDSLPLNRPSQVRVVGERIDSVTEDWGRTFQ